MTESKVKYYAALPLPWTDLTENIKQEDLDKQPGSDPIERRHHITLHILLPDRPSAELIKQIKCVESFPVTVSGLGCFENKDKDVLFMKVKVDDKLLALHGLIVSSYGMKWPRPEYTPHVTIAFLKPGKAKEYTSSLKMEKNITVTANVVEFRAHGDGSKVIDSITFGKSV